MEATCEREEARSSSVMSHKKRRISLPVYVVEDHNEALYYIYRGIGSKRLPFSGGTMIHFDSHPDLMLPKKLQPDKIKVMDHVLDVVSIESWIMPTVFAGHITTIVWMKPPWADQIADGTYHFTIGHHKESDEIRLTSPDPYFVSEVLYAPCEELDQTVDATLVVQTLGDLQTAPEGPEEKSQSLEEGPHRTADGSATALTAGRSTSDKGDQTASRVKSSPTALPISSHKAVTEQAARQEVIVGAGGEAAFGTCLEPPDPGHSPSATQSGVGKSVTPSVSAPPTFVFPVGEEGKACPRHLHDPSPLGSSVTVSPGQPYLLDIDLDFYSTRNPFRTLYDETQFSLLKELYRFPPLPSTSHQDLQQATEQRRQQLGEVEAMLRHVEAGGRLEEFPDSPRRQMVQELLDTFRGQPVDYRILHDCGCTCDDTELPHHVSSREEVLHLVEDTKKFLKAMPTPAMVTIARSSRDDYCPPEDVDFIQETVLKMLEEVFGQMDVKCDYGRGSSTP